MPQYITIKNFGPITSIEKMEVKDFMLFIGERATGKSTIAKLIFFFKDVVDDEAFSSLYNYYAFKASGDFFKVLQDTIYRNFEQTFSQIVKYDSLFEASFFYSDDSQNYVKITASKVLLGLSIKQFLDSKLPEIKDFVEEEKTGKPSKLQETLRNSFFDTLNHEIIDLFNLIVSAYIPDHRVELAKNISDKSYSDYRDIVGESFKDLLQEYRTYSQYIADDNYLQKLNDYQEKILKGNKLSIEFASRDSIVLVSGQEIPLASSSSGFQEISWIFIALKYLLSRRFVTFLVIEEPESHLDPKAQSLIMDAIALYGNRSIDNKFNQVIITTHSPFILGRLNNILYASKLSKEHMDEVLELGFKPEILLDPVRVAAYKCIDGGVVSILSEGLVENEEVDNISDKTLNDLDLLIDLDLKYEKRED